MKYTKTHHTESFFIDFYLKISHQEFNKNKSAETKNEVCNHCNHWEKHAHTTPAPANSNTHTHTHTHTRVTSVPAVSGNGLGNGSSAEAKKVFLLFVSGTVL